MMIPLGIFLGKKDYDTETSEGFQIAGIVFSLIIFAVGTITIWNSYTNHLEDIEALKIIHDEISIYEERSNSIKTQVASILIEKYSEHEKGIFDKLSGDGIGIYLVKYPELHSHETFKSYCDIMIELEDKIYNKRIDELNLQKSIKIRERGIHTMRILLPN